MNETQSNTGIDATATLTPATVPAESTEVLAPAETPTVTGEKKTRGRPKKTPTETLAAAPAVAVATPTVKAKPAAPGNLYTLPAAAVPEGFAVNTVFAVVEVNGGQAIIRQWATPPGVKAKNKPRYSVPEGMLIPSGRPR